MEKNRVSVFLIRFLILSGAGFFGCNPHSSERKTFYVSPAGNDNYEGSITKPWQTLERANRLVLSPGDTVLFEGGSVFRGTFYLDSVDSGDETGRVVIGSYGDGEAIIDGGTKEGIVVTNAGYFKIGDLIVKGAGRKSGNITNGILISAADYFELDNIEVFGFQHSGVLVMGSRNSRLTRITAHDNGFAGIHVTGKHANDTLIFDNENLYIGHCVSYNNPGDPTVLSNHSGNGILASSVLGGTMEYCEAFNNGWDMPWTGNGPVGIWIWDCRNFVIQYCLSHHNMTNLHAGDGGGFDLDGGVSSSLIQYCISWSNQGAGIGLFEFGASKPWENNVVRYNISRNDGIKNAGSLSVWKAAGSGIMRNCAVYNNTFINDTSRGYSMSITEHFPGLSFMNNIFVCKNEFLVPGQGINGESFSGNCFWRMDQSQSFKGTTDFHSWAVGKGKEISDGRLTGFLEDPMLVNPKAEILPGMSAFGRDSLTAFRLRPDSPLAGRGVDPGSPYGYENSYTGIDGSEMRHDNVFEIGAAGVLKKQKRQNN